MTEKSEKAEGALKTIREVSDLFGIPQHILRYWETRFPELRPLQRAGNRRYYRTADVALIARIDGLLNREGYTIRGVQKLLASPAAVASKQATPPAERGISPAIVTELRAIRTILTDALRADRIQPN